MRPIVFTIPGLDLPIYSYGVMLGLAFIGGWYTGFYFANREGLSYKTMTWSYVLAIIFALLGARLAHVITNPSTARMYGLFHALFASKCEGLVAYGGYIGGALAVVVYTRLKKTDFWSVADCSTPSLALGLGLTRIGCFLAGCCHGKATDVAWGVVFPAGSQASRNPDCIPAGAAPGMVPSLPVHPTQLYESALGFALFGLAWFLVKRRKFTGQTFLILICCYAVGRYLLEIIRADDDRGTVWGLFSTSQFIGLVLLPLAIGLYLWRRKHAPAPPEPLTAEQVHEKLLAEGVLKPAGGQGAKASPAKSKSQAKSRKKN